MLTVSCGVPAAKYRRVVMSERVDEVLKEKTCIEIEKTQGDCPSVEIGNLDRDHAHEKDPIGAELQSDADRHDGEECNCARSGFAKAPEVKELIVGRRVLGKRLLAPLNTVGQHSSESVIAAYIANHGEPGNKQLHKGQLELGLC